MTDFVDALETYIVANTSLVYGIGLFKAGLEDDGAADPAYSLVEYQGSITETMKSGIAVENPQLQVAGRGASYDATRAGMIQIRDLLLAASGTTQSSIRFIFIGGSGASLHYLGRDGNNRHQFTINFGVSF